jgi:hypothetical protein
MGTFNKFAGQWQAKAFFTENSEELHTADPSHAAPSTDPNPVWNAPADVNDNQADFIYADDAVVGDWFPEPMGLVYDTTPTDHNVGGDFDTSATPVDQTQSNAASAGRSYGADIQHSFAAPLLQDYTTTYIGKRFEGLDNYEVNPVALVRGLNADPANNPEGFRRGWVEQSFTDRKLQVGERTHDRRFLTPNLPYLTPDSEPVTGPYGTPFSSLAKSMTSISQNPFIRREPVSISDSVTDDGSGQDYDSQPGDWVAG